MSILKQCILYFILACLLSGCQTRSDNFYKARSMQLEDKVALAKKLNIKIRMDLYEELARYNGHPADLDISYSFQNEPLDTFNEIISRIQKKNNNFQYYADIILFMEDEQKKLICKQPNFHIVQSYSDKIQGPGYNFAICN